ncbi:hypothetical protein EDC04DRAFT_2803106 [Pisolithus marmoratus]|nr:hypothetical protein EDC04DRAFT_2803106 [Pisolithus marmoratus]
MLTFVITKYIVMFATFAAVITTKYSAPIGNPEFHCISNFKGKNTPSRNDSAIKVHFPRQQAPISFLSVRMKMRASKDS